MRPQLKSLQAALRDARVCAVLTNTDEFPNPNFRYCTDHDGHGTLFVPPSGASTLFISRIEKFHSGNGIRVRQWKKDTLKTFRPKVRRSLGIDFTHTNLQQAKELRKCFRGKRLLDISALLERLRLQKNPAELSAVAKACSISDRIYTSTLRKFRRFRTEQDVATFMKTEAARHGVEISFDPIVASGRNAAVPHHKPSAKKLRKGFCIIDFGVKVNGYCSDTTRTVYLGKPTERERGFYTLVQSAQEHAIQTTTSDRRCNVVYGAAAAALGKYKKYFIHGLGHGVGLQIHEAPSLTLHSKHLLVDNAPFTIEPGIYLPKRFGIRIEDTVVLKNGKPKLLTKFPKRLYVLRTR